MIDAWTMGSENSTEADPNYNTGFTPFGKKGTALPKPKFTPEVAKNMQDPNGDHLWLFRKGW